MPLIEIGKSGQRLSRALLIYTDHDSYSRDEDPRSIVITEHAVEEGAIQPGHVLDTAAFIRLLGQRKARNAKTPRGEFTWHFPRLLAEHAEWWVWWSPAGVRDVFVKGKAGRAWIPPLLWMAHRAARTAFLWAMSTPEPHPTQTILHRPSWSNIHDDCGICLGDMQPGRHTPPEWEHAFWITNFIEAKNLNSTTPYAPEEKFQKKIGPLAETVAAVAARRRAPS